MNELQKVCVMLLKQEHQDWVSHIREAEANDEGLDLNLGGNFADRLETMVQAFQEFAQRNRGKKIK